MDSNVGVIQFACEDGVYGSNGLIDARKHLHNLYKLMYLNFTNL